MVDIRLCRESEIGDVMSFIDEYWGKGHIMAVDKELMDWQHKEEGYYNFAVAYVDGELSGILGFIPVSHFDGISLGTILSRTAYGAIWKVKPGVNAPLLGVRLLEFIETGYKFIAVGINDTVKDIYLKRGYHVDKMNHYYIMNEDIFGVNYKLIKGRECGILTGSSCIHKILHPRLIKLTTNYTMKTGLYLENRYGIHPYYVYEFFEVLDEDSGAKGIIVTRDITQDGAKAIRIVDYVGDLDALKNAGKSLMSLIKQKGAEYIDILNYGIQKEIFFEAGFREAWGDDIVPNYFEPFTKENVTIQLAIPKEGVGKVWIFKGDGDQDRPNIIHKKGVVK